MQNPTVNTKPLSAYREFACRVGLAILCGLTAFTPIGSSAQTPIVIQFSHVVAADTAKGRGALRFKELAEARTSGRVKVEVYANSTLYKDREELEALRLGAVQMLAPSLTKLATLGGGDFEAFDLPFLFRDHAAFRAVASGPVGAAILQKLEVRGIKGLAYWDNGFKVFTANRSLHHVSDFNGLRIRVQASRASTAQMRAVGAEPRVTPLADVYNDLKQGLLDGQEGVASNIYTQHLHDVQKHLTISNHGYLAYAVIVNKGFWEGLPSELRATLETALKEATVYANGLAEAENAQALERIRASGKVIVYTLSDAERAQWRAAMARVYQDASAWIPPQTIAAIKAAAGPGP